MPLPYSPSSSSRPKLRGQLTLPGDKSISHRALLFNALSGGIATISGLSTGQDVLSTQHCLEALGCHFTSTPSSKESGDTQLQIDARQFLKHINSTQLDCGNSGTTARLLCGVLAGTPQALTLLGDDSLSRRPMKRVIDPLASMGLIIESTDNRLPLTINPIENYTPKGMTYTLPMASAQVKSAVLLAGLWSAPEDTVTVIEPLPSRDHTERMLSAMGCVMSQTGNTLTLVGRKPDIHAADIHVPGDISSAAFLMVACALLPGSSLTLNNVSLNPSRTPMLALLQSVGASVNVTVERESVGEAMGQVIIEAPDTFSGDITLTPETVPLLIDEIPILTILGLFNDGMLHVRGAEELRHKESDRLAAMVAIVKACGVDISETPDGFSFKGDPQLQLPESIYDVVFETHHDHRLVMSLEVLNLRAKQPLNIQGKEWVKISYPSFYSHLERLLAI